MSREERTKFDHQENRPAWEAREVCANFMRAREFLGRVALQRGFARFLRREIRVVFRSSRGILGGAGLRWGSRFFWGFEFG